jgi:glycosyltransferase involved in cell wall biosynthesis
LPQPPKGDKPRVALLVPPDLPIPAVHGGAVEGLVTHLVRQNQIEKKLELLVVSPFDAQALQAAHPYSQTLFCYVPKANTLQTLWHRVCYKISCITGGSRYWNIYNHQATKRLKKYFFDFAICEGGCLDSWSETAAFVGANRMIAHMHGMTTSNPLVDSLYHAGISISNYALQEWQATSTLPGNANYILPNCVDLSLFNTLPNPAAAQRKASLGFSSQDFVVFFCGRVCDGKGIHKLVQAMLQISDPHVKQVHLFLQHKRIRPFLKNYACKHRHWATAFNFWGLCPTRNCLFITRLPMWHVSPPYGMNLRALLPSRPWPAAAP